MNPSEQKYSAYERELAAVAYCLINWMHYSEGCPRGVIVIADHKTLTNNMDQQQFTQVQMRWVRLGLFQCINPIIKYQSEKTNVFPDALSRSVNMIMGESKIQSTEDSQWIQAQQDDLLLKEQIQRIREGRSSKYQISSKGLLSRSQKDRQQIIVPMSLRQNTIQRAHNDPTSGHQGIHRTIEQLPRYYHWKQMH